MSQQTASPSVVNAASMLAGPIAPGEIVSIFGLGIGPVTPATAQSIPPALPQLSSDKHRFCLAASRRRCSMCRTARSRPRRLTRSRAEHGGCRGPLSRTITRQGDRDCSGVRARHLHGERRHGTGRSRNQDGTLNSTVDPAPRGSVISLYATGEGVTSRRSADGQPAASLAPQPVLPVTVTIGGSTAEILLRRGNARICWIVAN